LPSSAGTPWGRSWRAEPPKIAKAKGAKVKGAKKVQQKEAESFPVTPMEGFWGIGKPVKSLK
jgi:hypothetical protein